MVRVSETTGSLIEILMRLVNLIIPDGVFFIFYFFSFEIDEGVLSLGFEFRF